MTQTPTDPRQQSLDSFLNEVNRPAEASGQHEGLVAPGQEERAAEILKELGHAEDDGDKADQADQGDELILGKFKSQADLEKAYKELERKVGQPKDSEPEVMKPEDYSKEWATETFGEELANRFETAGFNPIELDQRIAAGKVSIEDAATELAKASGLSQSVAETYLRGLRGGEGDGATGMNDDEQRQVLEKFGGEEKFRDLARWAKANAPEEQVKAYNEVLQTGNRQAVELALWAFQALRDAAEGRSTEKPLVEPQLISGSAPTSTANKFESQAQALQAMNKRNDMGERLYDVDEAYRKKVATMIANSDW